MISEGPRMTLLRELSNLEPGQSVKIVRTNDGEKWRIFRHTGGGFIGSTLYAGTETMAEGDSLVEALQADREPWER